MYSRNVQQNPLCAASCHNESSCIPPVLAYEFLSRCNFSTTTNTLLYSSINRLYRRTLCSKLFVKESVKVYLHMHNGNVQQNPLCVESCVTKDFSISPRFSPTMFDSDANSVLLRAHLCTAVDSTRRKPCVRNCSRERKGLYNGNNVLLAHLCTATLIGSTRRTLCSKLFMMRA